MAKIKGREKRKNLLHESVDELRKTYEELSKKLVEALKLGINNPIVDQLIQKQNMISSKISASHKKISNLESGSSELGSALGTWTGKLSEYD